MGNVSQRILDQFARNLESEVLSGGGQTEETPSEGVEAARASAAATAGEESLDLLSVVGTPALRQVAPAVAGLVLGLLIGNYVSSRRTLRAYQEAMRLMSYGQLHGSPTSKWWRRPGH